MVTVCLEMKQGLGLNVIDEQDNREGGCVGWHEQMYFKERHLWPQSQRGLSERYSRLIVGLCSARGFGSSKSRFLRQWHHLEVLFCCID